MDYRFWFAGIGIASVLVMWGLHSAGRRSANARILSRGALAEGEIVQCTAQGSRFTWTEVTYRYTPDGGAPITVTRKIDGQVVMLPGQHVAVRYLPSHPHVSLLVGHEARHDAS